MCFVLLVPALQKNHSTGSVVTLQSAPRHCIRTVVATLLSQTHASQAPESAATNSAWPLLSAIIDCSVLDAVVGYQPSLPRNHDAVLLALNRSAYPAQSESPYVSTEPTGALFTTSRLSVVGRTHSSYLCRLHVQGLMRPFPSHSADPLGRSITIVQQAVGTLFVRFQAALAHLFYGVPISVLVSS